jgi:hypothetical protein
MKTSDIGWVRKLVKHFIDISENKGKARELCEFLTKYAEDIETLTPMRVLYYGA